MAKKEALCLCAPLSHPSPVGESESGAVDSDSGSSRGLVGAVVCRKASNGGSSTLDHLLVLWGSVPGDGYDRYVSHSVSTSPGLAPKRDRLRLAGLSVQVEQTIQEVRAESTTACCKAKLLGFQLWYDEMRLDPLLCAVGSFLSSLQC